MMHKVLYIYILSVSLLLLAGCTKVTELPEGEESALDYGTMVEITPGSISLRTDEPVSRAGEQIAPMEVGKTFRLYAFERGVTDMEKLLATRAYTIVGKAGVPQLNSGQEKLFLPLGEVDIYLVGPLQVKSEGLMEEDENGVLQPITRITDVATPEGVNPLYGADLVSSRTPLTVEVGANQFQATPLRHRMAKVEVVVERPENPTYENLKVNTIVLMNQMTEGEFVFDENGGQVTPTGEGEQELSPPIAEEVKGHRFRSAMYMIPRVASQMRIGVYFTCNQIGSAAVVERRLNSGIMEDQVLAAGELTRFITRPKLSTDLEFRVRVMPWDNVYMPNEELTTGENILFSYNGLDAPFVGADGKRYWRDRSGRGNHAELVGDIRYNPDEHYYYAAQMNAYIKVPSLGVVPTYTLEFTQSSGQNANSRIWDGSKGGYGLVCDLPADGNDVLLQAPGFAEQTYSSYAGDMAYMENLATWGFAYTSGKQALLRNGSTLKSWTVAYTPTTAFSDNRMLNYNYSVSDYKARLYAARMTTRYLADTDVLKQNYRNDMAAFARVDVDKDFSNQQYVKQGLILDLRGTTGAGSAKWDDQSDMQNDAKISGTVTYDPTNKCYTFSGGYMQLLNSLGAHQTFTVEIVAIGSDDDNTMLKLASSATPQTTAEADACREFSAHYMSSSGVCFYAPYGGGGRSKVGIEMLSAKLPYTDITTQPHSWSLVRQSGAENRMDAYIDGLYMEGMETALPGTSKLKELKFGYIGCNGVYSGSPHQPFNGSIYAIRIYDRVLTEFERQLNYQVDKRLYNILH